MNMTEADWKHLRVVHRAALERFCERVLTECRDILDDHNSTAHERYGRLYELMRKRDRDLAAAFDDLRRSTAMPRLLAMRSLGVVTPEEVAAFSFDIHSVADE